jgi:hypothetical protein
MANKLTWEFQQDLERRMEMNEIAYGQSGWQDGGKFWEALDRQFMEVIGSTYERFYNWGLADNMKELLPTHLLDWMAEQVEEAQSAEELDDDYKELNLFLATQMVYITPLQLHDLIHKWVGLNVTEFQALIIWDSWYRFY